MNRVVPQYREMITRRLCTYIVLVAIGVVVGIAPAASQELPRQLPADVQREVSRAFDQIWSPYCQAQMLEICTSSQGAALRDSIRVLALAGSDSDELVEWVIGNHGEEYRAVPSSDLQGLVLWLVPPLALLFGFGVVLIVIRRLRASAPAPVVVGHPEISADDEAKLRNALLEMEESEDPAF